MPPLPHQVEHPVANDDELIRDDGLDRWVAGERAPVGGEDVVPVRREVVEVGVEAGHDLPASTTRPPSASPPIPPTGAAPSGGRGPCTRRRRRLSGCSSGTAGRR